MLQSFTKYISKALHPYLIARERVVTLCKYVSAIPGCWAPSGPRLVDHRNRTSCQGGPQINCMLPIRGPTCVAESSMCCRSFLPSSAYAVTGEAGMKTSTELLYPC